MTATNGWPGKPGVPLNPEKDGWHWVSLLGSGHPQIMEWFSDAMVWADGWTVEACAKHLRYLGPVLTPDESTALQKRIAELEGALRFYADPFKYTDIHGDDVRVPHFYSETDFGETARVALGLDKPWSLKP